MSVKKEYDLERNCGLTANTAAEERSFEIGQDDHQSDIDIKYEYPYQSLQFSLEPPEEDIEHQEDNFVETTDPLELTYNDDGYCQPNVERKSSEKKLKKIKTAICTKCNIGFPSPFLFEEHMIQIHQDDRPYPCKHCGKPFATPSQQKCHETIHDPNRFQGEPQFPCDICGKSYHLKRSLATHKIKFHGGFKPPKKPQSTPIKEHHSTSGVRNPNVYRRPKEIHSCPHCDLTFDMKCLLNRHIIVHTKKLPFSCQICQQPFSRNFSLQKHIKSIHQKSNTSPTARRTQLRPKWQYNQPCPCSICGKIFSVPNRLLRHMRIHTGEKPFSCNYCNKKFRVRGLLNSHTKRVHIKEQLRSNPLKLFKCRVCGKNDFVIFSDLRVHRLRVHTNIPYESEKEKPFACGICGKPHFLREGALICALLGHDPGPLRKDMFKIKCPECPDEEVFGFHNVLALRRHWGRVHGDKQLPAKFRQGMYTDGKKLKDELPSCRIDKAKSQSIRMSGPSPEQVKSEERLYVDLDLFEVPEEETVLKKENQEQKVRIRKKGECFCTICGLKLSSSSILARHVKVVHDPNRKEKTRKVNKCESCGKEFKKLWMLHRHEENVHSNELLKRKVGRPKRKNSMEGINAERRNETKKEINGDSNGFGRGLSSVNIKDRGALQAVLNFQTVTVNLRRINLATI